MPRIITKDIINERLADRKIKLIGEYLGSKTQTLFCCSHGKKWMIAPHHIFSGRDCGCLVNRLRMTKEQVNEQIAYSGITMIDEYTGTQKSSLFLCSEGHQFRITPSRILHSKRGCPQCAEYGFNKFKPAFIYILHFGDYIKYGITNNLSSRLRVHQGKNGKFTVIETREYEIGEEALIWEKSIKTHFGGRYATKEQCPDGYTETLSPDVLQKLIDFTRER